MLWTGSLRRLQTPSSVSPPTVEPLLGEFVSREVGLCGCGGIADLDPNRSILEVIGHRSFRLQTGGVIPTVVKVEYVTEEKPSPTSTMPSGTVPVCAVNPTAT